MAYETGFHIGDGSLTIQPRYTYRYVLSGNALTEYPFYRDFLSPLITNLYGLTPRISVHRNSVYLTTYSKALLFFKANEIGLTVGPKDNDTQLPESILKRGEASVSRLLSGLFDADGSVKTRKTSSGNYPRISFAQKSKRIVTKVKDLLLHHYGITSTVYVNEYYDARISKLEVRWFLDINGFKNARVYWDRIVSEHPIIRKKLQSILGPSWAWVQIPPGPLHD